MDANVFRMAYVSEAHTTMPVRELAELEATSQRNNRETGIFGVLITDRDRFVQVLEGPKEAVQELFARIERDPRHHTVQVFATDEAASAAFERWSMGVFDVASRSPAMNEVFLRMFRTFQETPVPLSLTHKRLQFFQRLALF